MNQRSGAGSAFGALGRLARAVPRRSWAVILALGVNALLFASTYLAFTPRYQTNDDVAVMLRLSGLSMAGEPVAEMIITSRVIGEVLAGLYGALPAIPWYPIYLLAGLFVAHVVFLYVALRRIPAGAALALYGVYFALIALNLLTNLQYTAVASVLCVAGLGLLLFTSGPAARDGGEERRGSRPLPRALAGIALVVLGSMIRWESFLLVICLFGPILAVRAASLLRRGRVTIGFLRHAWPIAAALALALGVNQVDRHMYAGDDWHEWVRLNQLRDLVDYRFLDEIDDADRRAALHDAGWSENDYRMLTRWFFMDSTTYTEESFARLLTSHARAATVDEGARLRSGMDAVLNVQLYSRPGRGTVLLALLTLVFFPPDRRRLALTALAFATAATLVLVIAVSLKPPPARVAQGILVFCGLVPLWLVEAGRKSAVGPPARPSGDREGERLRWLRPVLAGLVAIALIAQTADTLGARRRDSAAAAVEARELKDFVRELQPSGDELYVVWGPTIPWENLPVFETPDYLRDFRVFFLGWMQRSSPELTILQTYGISDLYRSLVERDDVFLIATPELLELYRRYMVEHYGVRTVGRPAHEGAGVVVYAIDIEKPA